MGAHQPVDLLSSLWFLGWLVAVGTLFVLALGLPLQTRLVRHRARLYAVALVGAIVGVAVLANVAVSLHDMHLDLTREKVFTPSEKALEVVDRLQRPLRLTYFFQGEDQAGKRAAEIVRVMGRRNPLLQVRTVDPDKEPSLARNAGVELYNAAVLEAGGRRITVRTVDETEIAIGIQRVLRERVVTVCFLEGHHEYPMDAFEFHTHFEAGAGHSHDDAASAVVQTTGHGVGRMRRVLEGLGYDVRVITPAVEASIPQSCSVVINAGPRTTYLPAESRALEAYLEQGGSLLLMFDLGFVLEPGLESLLARLGMRLPQQVLIDPKSHYGKDPETVAVTAYEPDPITRNVSLTFEVAGVALLVVRGSGGTVPRYSHPCPGEQQRGELCGHRCASGAARGDAGRGHGGRLRARRAGQSGHRCGGHGQPVRHRCKGVPGSGGGRCRLRHQLLLSVHGQQ